MLLLALLGAILLHDSLAISSDQYSDKQSLALLQQITKAYPNFIDLPYEDVVRYLALTRAELGITEVPPAKTETKSIQKQPEEDEQDKQDEMEAEEKAAAHVLAQAQAAAAALAQAEQAAVLKAKKEAGLFPQKKAMVEFVGMPEGAGRQRGSCDKILNNTPNVRWIHGKSNMQTGAMTLLLFMSQQCISCHDVAIKINSIYKTWRNRGLNVLAIHSSPKGYASSEEDINLLKAFIEEEGIEFAIVDVASKEGQQPVLKSTGLPDWKRAARTPTGAASLYRYMFDEMEYAVPLAIIYKNCVPLMSDPLDGYHIMALDRSIAASEELMLWPFGLVSDDAIQETGFQEAASQHGVAPEELEWQWDGDKDKEARAEAEAGGAPAGHEPVKRHGRRRKKQASRVSSTGADTGGGGGRKSSASASRRTSRADPRDDRSNIVENNDEAEEGEKEWQMPDDAHEAKSEKKKRSEPKVAMEMEVELEVEVDGFDEADSLFDGAPSGDNASGAAKRKSRLAESRREAEEDEQAEEEARKPRSRGGRGFSRRGRG